ncbi:MAG: hypothetical protein GZ085_14570 [Sulfuriferula multivorans]|uniref:Histidine kinase/HSP90-like ATPase domain-containing protein n=1 Tax=Sulfuriferula multivorans TaxID=1559896 RepID=A0A7C9P9Q2_9PROT|nr:hypothetical protein [Sulfuriferula multivorans]
MSAENDELLPVLASLKARVVPRFVAIGLQLDWRHDNTLHPSLQVAPHVTLQVLRIMQEALANVLKHARASVVSVHVYMLRDMLNILIKDDGVGMPDTRCAVGHGVANMHTRAGKIGASLEVSADGSGTTVFLSVPIPPYNPPRYTQV